MKPKSLLIIGDPRRMPELKDRSIQLVVTSPPCYRKESASNSESYESYLMAMQEVFRECYRVLEKGRYICLNVSGAASSDYPIFHYIPMLERAGFRYRDDIIWKKPKGFAGMRRVFIQTPYLCYPNSIYEHVLVFRKGNFDFKPVSKEERGSCRFDLSFALEHFNPAIWEFAQESANHDVLLFPEELPEAIIKLYTYVGETVLDPFLGSGTTMKAAWRAGRLVVGYQINEAHPPLAGRKAGFPDVRIIRRGGKNG